MKIIVEVKEIPGNGLIISVDHEGRESATEAEQSTALPYFSVCKQLAKYHAPGISVGMDADHITEEMKRLIVNQFVKKKNEQNDGKQGS